MGICQDPNGFLGRIGNLLYYMCKGKRMVRTFDADYMGKRVKKSPKYELFRVYGKLFGLAAKIASDVYRKAPKKLQEELVYKGLQSEATGLFKRTSMNEGQVRKFLLNKYMNYWENKKLVSELRKAGSKKNRGKTVNTREKNATVKRQSTSVKKKAAKAHELKSDAVLKKRVANKSIQSKKKRIVVKNKKATRDRSK